MKKDTFWLCEWGPISALCYIFQKIAIFWPVRFHSNDFKRVLWCNVLMSKEKCYFVTLCVFIGLLPGTEYKFFVIACNEVGESDRSDVEQGKTKGKILLFVWGIRNFAIALVIS